jgi:hypothetical protein
MPDWLKTLIHDVVLELLHAELTKHGVLTTPPPVVPPPAP